MRTFSKLITMLLCLELIVAPIQPELSLVATKAYAEDCPAGMQFDSTLNRCLTSAQTAKVMNLTASCPQGDVECYKTNAQNAFQEKVNAGEAPERKGNSKFNSIVQIAAIAGPVTYAVIGMSGSKAKCSSPAFYGMIAAAAAVVIGDNLANMQHKSRLKKIKEDWGKIVNPEEANGDKDKERQTSIEAQSQAFEMLARAEDSLASAAKMKEKFFLVASLAYGVTAAISAMEIFKGKSLKTKAIAALNRARAQSPALAAAAAEVQTSTTQTQTSTATEEANQESSSTPTPAAVAAQRSQAVLTQVEAAALAMNKSVPIAQAAATAQAGTPNAPTAASAAEAVGSAATATNLWSKHVQSTMCIPMGVEQVTTMNSESHKGLFDYYVTGKTPDIRQEIQSYNNIRNSENLASLVMNIHELNGNTNYSVEDYENYQGVFSSYESEDKKIFEYFKHAVVQAINNLNPIASAFAREEAELAREMTDEGGGGSGTGSSQGGSQNSGEVNTNAAKAYKEDKAKGIDLMSIGLGVGVGVLLGVKKEIGGKLITSTGRLIFSGVMAGMTYMMSRHAGSQADASKERAKVLREMKEEFNTAAGAVYACKSEDRNNPGMPNCYCYTADNQRNPNRGNSQVCQKLWAGKTLNSTDYLAKGNTSSRICINNQSKADPTCACKQTKTCMKAGMGGITGLNPGTMSVLSSSLAPLNGIANGSVDAANLDTASLQNAAARMNKINEELGKKVLGKNKKAKEDKFKAALTTAANRSLPSSSFMGGSGSSNLPTNAGEAARMLEKELESNTPTGIGGGGDFLAAPTNQAPEQGFDFGLTQDQLAAQETQIAELMKEDLDYGANDINQGSNTNIFEVLSNRYQRSGMRRLFDEEGKTKADAPAKSDIVQ